MLNIYKYHTNPKILINYENHWQADPFASADILINEPNNKEVEAVVIKNDRAILRYVKATGNPLPAGLRAMISRNDELLDSHLVQYAEAINKRVPELEDKLIKLKSGFNIMRYIDVLIKGPWKEAEPALAADDYYRREYVRRWLDGDWSKLDRGQHTAEESVAWVDFVKSVLDNALLSYTENLQAIRDEEGGEMLDEDDLDVSYRRINSNSFAILKSETVVGKVKRDGNEISLLTASDELVTTFDVRSHEDDLWDEVYDYVYDVIIVG